MDSQTAAIVGEHTQYMVATYVRPPPMMVKGEGCYLWDIENRRYLDFTAGIAVNALGHCNPEMERLMTQQVGIAIPFGQEEQLVKIKTGKNPNTHLQSIPQPLDRRPLSTHCH